jgi:hypothetical protein
MIKRLYASVLQWCSVVEHKFIPGPEVFVTDPEYSFEKVMAQEIQAIRYLEKQNLPAYRQALDQLYQVYFERAIENGWKTKPPNS